MNLESIKSELKNNKLFVTWTDENTEKRITDIINNAVPTLNFKVGADLNYDTPGQERNLLLNYCLYDWNNCVNLFDDNYSNELMQLRIKYEVQQYATELQAQNI